MDARFALAATLTVLIALVAAPGVLAQEEGGPPTAPPFEPPADAGVAGPNVEIPEADAGPSMAERLESATETAADAAEKAGEKIDEVAKQIDADAEAQKVKDSVLKPIYQLAEAISFSAFHWVAFTLMTAGVVSFGLQLVLGKLVVLSKMGLSITEILGDALGLAISLIGLVLTTQAATENSQFTESAFSVLSATVLGLMVGFLFYLWGQRQELQAVKGRSAKKED
ncbi:MAG: hypothetical protein AAGJ46_03245 [Planctomycetota bacterium]